MVPDVERGGIHVNEKPLHVSAVICSSSWRFLKLLLLAFAQCESFPWEGPLPAQPSQHNPPQGKLYNHISKVMGNDGGRYVDVCSIKTLPHSRCYRSLTKPAAAAANARLNQPTVFRLVASSSNLQAAQKRTQNCATRKVRALNTTGHTAHCRNAR